MYPLSCFSTCSESKEDGEGASYWAETSETSAPFLFLAVFTAPSTLAEGRLQEGHLAEEGGSSQDPLFPGRLCLFGTTHFVVCVPLPLHESSYIRCLVPCCLCVVPLIFKIMLLGSLGNRASELIDDLVPKIVKLGCNPGCISSSWFVPSEARTASHFWDQKGRPCLHFWLCHLDREAWQGPWTSEAQTPSTKGGSLTLTYGSSYAQIWLWVSHNIFITESEPSSSLWLSRQTKTQTRTHFIPHPHPPLQVFISVLLEKLWCHKCLLQAFRSSTWISIWQGSPLLLLLFSFKMKRKV